MEFQIDKNWKITNDERQFILMKSGISKKGEAIWRVNGYFTDTETMIRCLINKVVRDSDVKTLKEIFNLMLDIRKKICNIERELHMCVDNFK